MTAVRIWLIAVLLCLIVPISPAQAKFLALSIDNNIPAEIAAAAKQGKRLIVMFQEAGCPWCHKMRERVFAQPKVQAYFSDRFVLIEQDVKGDLDLVSHDGLKMTQKEFARALRVRGTPTFIFYELDGSFAVRAPGYQDVATFIATGKYVHHGIYKTGKSLARWHMEQQ